MIFFQFSKFQKLYKNVKKKLSCMVQHIHIFRPKCYMQAKPYDCALWCSCVRNGGGLIERCTSLVCLLCMVRGVTPHLVLLPQLGHGHTVKLSHCHKLTLSHQHTGILEKGHSIKISQFLTVTIPHCETVILLFCQSVTLAYCHVVKLSYFHNVTLAGRNFVAKIRLSLYQTFTLTHCQKATPSFQWEEYGNIFRMRKSDKVCS